MNQLENIKQYVSQKQTEQYFNGTKFKMLQHVLDRINLELHRCGEQLVKGMSKHRCPACMLPLSLEKTTQGVWIFCAHGPCEGKAANAGAYDHNEDLAFHKLERLIEQEWEGVKA